MVNTDKDHLDNLGWFEEEKWAGSRKEIWPSSRQISEWRDRQTSKYFEHKVATRILPTWEAI